jgi:hypothetical protein
VSGFDSQQETEQKAKILWNLLRLFEGASEVGVEDL